MIPYSSCANSHSKEHYLTQLSGGAQKREDCPLHRGYRRPIFHLERHLSAILCTTFNACGKRIYIMRRQSSPFCEHLNVGQKRINFWLSGGANTIILNGLTLDLVRPRARPRRAFASSTSTSRITRHNTIHAFGATFILSIMVKFHTVVFRDGST